MTTIIKNIGPMFQEKNTRGEQETNGDQGTVTVWYEGQQFVFGPNEAKSFSDDGIAAAVLAADSRLRLATQADGMAAKSTASTAFSEY